MQTLLISLEKLCETKSHPALRDIGLREDEIDELVAFENALRKGNRIYLNYGDTFSGIEGCCIVEYPYGESEDEDDEDEGIDNYVLYTL